MDVTMPNISSECSRSYQVAMTAMELGVILVMCLFADFGLFRFFCEILSRKAASLLTKGTWTLGLNSRRP